MYSPIYFSLSRVLTVWVGGSGVQHVDSRMGLRVAGGGRLQPLAFSDFRPGGALHSVRVPR